MNFTRNMKYFCIGHNKCATSTLTSIFKANGLSSHHGPMNWSIEEFDSFTDTGGVPFIGVDKKNKIIHHSTNAEHHHFCNYKNFNIQNLIWLNESYRDSTFIYNTRTLQGWMLSRLAHGIRLGGDKNQFFPASDQMLLSWIKLNYICLYQVLNYFLKNRGNLIILNTSNPSWVSFLSKTLGFNMGDGTRRENVTNEDTSVTFSTLSSFFERFEFSEVDRLSVIPRNLLILASKFTNNIINE